MKKNELIIKISIVITGCLLVSSVVVPVILAGGLHVEIESATVIICLPNVSCQDMYRQAHPRGCFAELQTSLETMFFAVMRSHAW